VRRNWLVAATVVGIVAIVIALLIFRLTDGDSGSVETTAWADSVCASLSDWRSSITSLADVSGGTLTPDSLGEKLDAAESATSQLITELKKLGPPDLEAGEELSLELNAAADRLEADFETLKSGAENAAEADTPSAFLQALAALAPVFQGLLDQIRTTVDDLQNASVTEEAKTELQQAFDEAESCRQLAEQS
jgi:hypothetical protein